MKNFFLMAGALVVGLCLPAVQAQELSVAPVSETPAVKVAATGIVHAAKSPKAGAGSFFGASGSTTTNSGMTITSDRIEYDYKEMVIAFDENVQIVDAQYTMTAQRMLVFLEGTNQIKRIFAIGHVDVVQPPDRHATCEKATYEHATGAITLTGNPVLMRGADRVVGTKIIIYQNDQRMVVEGGGRVNLSPETMKNRELKP